ncbi:MAG: DEAD/DEAH box helicase family protein [Actinobacteria bacterium]|nr:DEAD/DEAH box helicase family protein [Actinomycetota bacterium]
MATKTAVHDVIEQFRATSNVEAGTKFEKLMVDYFWLDPTLSVEYDEVQRWPDWPHRENTHDTGIDLVARNKLTGEWTAIQCKFYDPKHTLVKGDIDSFFTASGKSWDGISFTNRIIISTTDKWSKNAEDALVNQAIPVQRIGLAEIAESPIDWMRLVPGGLDFELKKAVKYGLRKHQKEAIAKITAGFATHDRGKWISACGTGKTFTSLKLAEQLCSENGGQLKVLFLAPSISLVSQSLREWMAQSQTDIRPFVVCSDTKAGRQAEDITTHDIPIPTTNIAKLAEGLASVGKRMRGMTVVFSTYQSIDVVAQAQKSSSQQFDLILCDEAHRTTGVKLPGDADESAFVKVHDNTFLPAARRLYMTATPRIYGDAAKKKADEAAAILTSMDNEDLFGPEFHRLGFGEAVEQRLLSDYKVMVLVVEGDAIAEPLQAGLADANSELSLDDAAKIVGCWNGLAKHTVDADFGPNPVPMKRAVAFLRDIRSSKGFAEAFPDIVDALTDEGDERGPDLDCDVEHVDGTMNALERADKLAWLKAPIPEGECRVLSNARCLSEGVDVPALDAVLFLHPRNSLVDVVQSVGRVMRRAPGKDYGYVILPVAIPAGLRPEEALNDNKRFRVVWDVLNALRSHDDRFNAMINSIDLDKNTKGKISIDIIGKGGPTDDEEGKPVASKADTGIQLPLFSLAEWRDSILARIVKKCGDREYWDAWADDVVDITANQTARINAILRTASAALTEEFDQFLDGLKANLNDSIDRDDAVSMLSQHLITKPVFDALFEHDGFAAHNPVSITMQGMVNALAGHGLDAETAKLDKFYESVRKRASQIETPAGRQAVIHELYENFFKKAFPKQSSSLGVVYTPVEIVDFILRAADQVCRQEFGYGLTNEGVHILDPFTGTGTFIVRLLESGIIQPGDLARKYASELWANEIMLLAYYIACVNIETTYQAVVRGEQPDADVPYVPFAGATLTDTFQITEDGDRADTSLIPVNNDRIEAQLAAPIKVIIGNPPYSAGQGSANDNNANLKYATLDARIAETYAAGSSRVRKASLYDSYIRAFRWASDRLGAQGVIAFVSNNGWLDSNSADGLRIALASEFSDLWIYNLRGNQRTAGELSRQEGGKVFGSGSRTGVSVLLGVKLASEPKACRLRYFSVADYMTAEEKLSAIAASTLTSIPWEILSPNDAGDWVNQRAEVFSRLDPLAARSDEPSGQPLLNLYTSGLSTARDAWCYNFNSSALQTNVNRAINFYNGEVDRYRVERPHQPVQSWANSDPKLFSWDRADRSRLPQGREYRFDSESVRIGLYRPFQKLAVYANREMNNSVYKLPQLFPTEGHTNLGFYVVGMGTAVPFSALMTDSIPNYHTTGAGSGGQFYPRWTFDKVSDVEQGSLLDTSGDVDEWGYRRVDNITDGILKLYQGKFGPQVSKDDVFYYVYGVLHSEQYRTTFAADLKRMLPRIPLAATVADFQAFTEAGRKLADLHVNYESVEPYPLAEQAPLHAMDPWTTYRVEKMKWANKNTKKAIVYNKQVTLGDIPAEAHRYMLGSRSALEWLIDRYQVKTDKASGIKNDPNDWCREHHEPRYVVDLVKRVTRVSVETMKIVDNLPSLPL